MPHRIDQHWKAHLLSETAEGASLPILNQSGHSQLAVMPHTRMSVWLRASTSVSTSVVWVRVWVSVAARQHEHEYDTMTHPASSHGSIGETACHFKCF